MRDGRRLQPSSVSRLLPFVFAFSLALPSLASADTRVRVPLRDNFSQGELNGIPGIVVADILLYALQPVIANTHQPWIGAPPSFDREVSEALYRGDGRGAWLERIPDYTGQIFALVGAVGWYTADALALRLRGEPLATDVNADHHLLAFLEATGIAIGLNQLVKLSVGRQRPQIYFDRPGNDPSSSEANLSFFSGHATVSFCLAAFVTRNLSDWLLATSLSRSSPAARLWLGRVLPATVLYGSAALVGYSRLVDQKHYLSDVLIGAAFGGLVGNLVYSLHFDGDGNPRRRYGVQLVPVAAGLGLNVTF